MNKTITIERYSPQSGTPSSSSQITTSCAKELRGEEGCKDVCGECRTLEEWVRAAYMKGVRDAADEWTRVEDELPEVDTPVEVITEYISSGKPMSDRFIAYMDEYGDTIICPTDESYGWQFNDVVVMWRKLLAPPNSNQVNKNEYEG
jgi:hypothetical protein